MGVFDRFVKTEDRSLENANVNVSADDFLQVLGWGDFSSSAGVVVNVDNALGVPAVSAAVNFISGTLASLPLEVHRKTDTGHNYPPNYAASQPASTWWVAFKDVYSHHFVNFSFSNRFICFGLTDGQKLDSHLFLGKFL